MRLGLLLVAVLLAGGIGVAQGTLDVPYSAAQQAGMQYALKIHNADRAAQDPPLPPVGLAAYARAQCQAVFTSYAEQRAQAREQQNTVRQKYLALTDAEKQQVEDLIDSFNP